MNPFVEFSTTLISKTTKLGFKNITLSEKTKNK